MILLILLFIPSPTLNASTTSYARFSLFFSSYYFFLPITPSLTALFYLLAISYDIPSPASLYWISVSHSTQLSSSWIYSSVSDSPAFVSSPFLPLSSYHRRPSARWTPSLALLTTCSSTSPPPTSSRYGPAVSTSTCYVSAPMFPMSWCTYSLPSYQAPVWTAPATPASSSPASPSISLLQPAVSFFLLVSTLSSSNSSSASFYPSPLYCLFLSAPSLPSLPS